MAEYIDRQEAISAIFNQYPELVFFSREDAAECIQYMDAADVAPVVHGTWIDRLDCDWTCSACKHVSQAATPYCAWCGAQMDGWRHRDDVEGTTRIL